MSNKKDIFMSKESNQYAESVFVKFLQSELHSLKRVDVLLDRYLASRIKGSAREKRIKLSDPNSQWMRMGARK